MTEQVTAYAGKPKRKRSHQTMVNYTKAFRWITGKKKNYRPDWSRISPSSNFVWKYPTIEACVRSAWDAVRKEVDKGNTAYQKIVGKALFDAFGVHPVDFIRSNRAAPILLPRQIAMCFLWKLGYSKIRAAAAYERDKTCVAVALKHYGKLIAGLPNVQTNNTTQSDVACDIRPTHISEQAGPLSS